MHEAVDDVIQRRHVDPDGLRRAMSASIGIHVAAVLALFFLPRVWFASEKPEPLRMTISFAGSPGEKSTGMIAAGSRPIEAVAPPPAKPTPVPPATPPKANSVAVAVKDPPKATPKPTTTASDPTATSRPQTTGAQVQSGTSVADTRSTSKTTGLTFGGGAIGDTSVTLDAEFCCPEYIAELQRRVLVGWRRDRAPETGSTTVVFVIRKDGTFTVPVIEKSGGSMLDAISKSAFNGLTLLPLPPQYKEDRLTIHLTFPYVR